MSDDTSFPASPHHHDAQGHDGKDHVSVATSGSGQTQSLDRVLRPTSASSAVAVATARQHSLGRNQPHHHHHHPLPLAGSANQNGARTNAAKEAKYTHTFLTVFSYITVRHFRYLVQLNNSALKDTILYLVSYSIFYNLHRVSV